MRDGDWIELRPKSTSLVAALPLLLPCVVRAGIVSFTPETTEIVLGVDDPIVEIDVTLASVDSLQFDAFDIVIGTHSGAEIVSISLSLEMIYQQACKWGCYPAGIYPSDLALGAFGFLGLYTPFPIGTLTVDTSGLGPGTYEILVDADFDGRSLAVYGLETEPLYGVGTIQIIPEPTSLTLLALGCFAIKRLRFRTP